MVTASRDGLEEPVLILSSASLKSPLMICNLNKKSGFSMQMELHDWSTCTPSSGFLLLRSLIQNRWSCHSSMSTYPCEAGVSQWMCYFGYLVFIHSPPGISITLFLWGTILIPLLRPWVWIELFLLVILGMGWDLVFSGRALAASGYAMVKGLTMDMWALCRTFRRKAHSFLWIWTSEDRALAVLSAILPLHGAWAWRPSGGRQNSEMERNPILLM